MLPTQCWCVIRAGHFFIDEEVLAQEGVTNLDRYRTVSGNGPLATDLFLDPLESS